MNIFWHEKNPITKNIVLKIKINIMSNNFCVKNTKNIMLKIQKKDIALTILVLKKF